MTKVMNLEIKTANEQINRMDKLNLKLGNREQQASVHFNKWIEPGELVQGQEKETIKTFT